MAAINERIAEHAEWRCAQGFAVAEQQLELPRGWLASGAPAPSAPQENGYANGANGAGAPAQPALRVTEEGDSIVITGPSLRAQARASHWCQRFRVAVEGTEVAVTILRAAGGLSHPLL